MTDQPVSHAPQHHGACLGGNRCLHGCNAVEGCFYARHARAATPAPAQALPEHQRTAPDRIYLHDGDDEHTEPFPTGDADGVTWSSDNATGAGVLYVRADLANEAPVAEHPEPVTWEHLVRKCITDPAVAERILSIPADAASEQARSILSAPYATSSAPEFDAWACDRCNGKGVHWESCQVAERESDVQTLRVHCDACEGVGYCGPDAMAMAQHMSAPQAPQQAEQTFTRAELLDAVDAERHACGIAVWMAKMDASEPGADDLGVAGWLEEAEQRIKNRAARSAEVEQQRSNAGASSGMEDENEALDLLDDVFSAYEDGAPCTDTGDDDGSFIGNAVRLDDETFHRCVALLKRRRPRPGADSDTQVTQIEACTYPACGCPFDAPADPAWCAKGLPQSATPALQCSHGDHNQCALMWCQGHRKCAKSNLPATQTGGGNG